MSAHYDKFDYPLYWEKRSYEHTSEVFAIQKFLEQIPKIETILDIGCGYGRLTPAYAYRAKRVILTDPSSKLLKTARQNLKAKNIKFIHSRLDTIKKKIRQKADLVVMVRVLHHLPDQREALNQLSLLIKKNGYLILEFANKRHLKATITQFCQGNFTFPLDIFPRDIRSATAKKERAIPFINYHPDDIEKKLKDAGFKILGKRSVSNIRSPLAKRFFDMETLFSIEKKLQEPMAKINFGPSIFILAQKQ